MNDNEVLVDKRNVRLSGEIGSEKTNYLIQEMEKLERKEDRDQINLYVNSRGGMYDDMIAIYDTMKGLDCEVNTIGVGRCMSAASVIVMAGTGERKAYEHTRFLIHAIQCSTKFQSIKDNEITHEEQKRIQSILRDLIARECGQTRGKVEKDLERDKFMSAEEAVHYGLIDEIIGG